MQRRVRAHDVDEPGDVVQKGLVGLEGDVVGKAALLEKLVVAWFEILVLQTPSLAFQSTRFDYLGHSLVCVKRFVVNWRSGAYRGRSTAHTRLGRFGDSFSAHERFQRGRRGHVAQHLFVQFQRHG